mmetsp:Transcript_158074/g.303305  ORF Transcript_158074/g.303305 Transcript_158074/m.303305 type:complete len:310 (-) Transcript_158074:154-1083(-)
MALRSDFGQVPDKRVPTNAKYQGVQTRLDTGASASRRPPAMPSAARHCDEEFKRIRPATLSRLIQEQQEEGFESVFNLAQGQDDAASQSSVAGSLAKPLPAKSRAAASVASVAGSVLSVIESDTCVAESRNLVLLDLREADDYEQCRLPFAISYPAAKINRDQFIPELHRCKRDTSKLLVVYHTNDSTTAAIATLLVRKGWQSVHALSGGFEEMVCSYPEVLEGDVPERKMSSRPNTGSTNWSGSVRSGSGYSRQSGAPRMPGEIRRGNSIPRRSMGSGRSASPSSVAGSVAGSVRSVRSASVRSRSVP